MENKTAQTLNIMPSQWQDPILLELHATRERLANQYGNDIRAICDAARHGILMNKNMKSQLQEKK